MDSGDEWKFYVEYDLLSEFTTPEKNVYDATHLWVQNIRSILPFLPNAMLRAGGLRHVSD